MRYVALVPERGWRGFPGDVADEAVDAADIVEHNHDVGSVLDAVLLAT
jgi:hypothetical protein